MNEQRSMEEESVSTGDETSKHGGENVGVGTTNGGKVKEHTKRKKKKSKKAPGAPIRGRSAYILFTMDYRDKVMED